MLAVDRKGVAMIFGRRALSGAKRQIVQFFARVRRRKAPSIELLLGSGGAAPFRGKGASS